jgi:WD40 repeat protein
VTAEHSPVTIWDIRTKHPLSEFKTDRTKSATCAIFSPNERLIAISYDITGVAPFSYVEVWDAFSHKLLYILKGHTNFVRSVAFSSDGTKLVTASLDFTARIWNLQTLRDQKSIVDAYRNGLPFEEVRDIIEKFLRSGGVASFSEEQRKLYSIGQHSNLP